jgi:uncharacterized membrane protein
MKYFNLEWKWVSRMVLATVLFAAAVTAFDAFAPIVVTLLLSCITYGALVFFLRLTPFEIRPKKVLQANA